MFHALLIQLLEQAKTNKTLIHKQSYYLEEKSHIQYNMRPFLLSSRIIKLNFAHSTNRPLEYLSIFYLRQCLSALKTLSKIKASRILPLRMIIEPLLPIATNTLKNLPSAKHLEASKKT